MLESLQVDCYSLRKSRSAIQRSIASVLAEIGRIRRADVGTYRKERSEEMTEPITYDQWREEAKKRYPDNNIVFVCPVCGYRQSVEDYKAAKAPDGTWGFSCIGRFQEGGRRAFGGKGKGPCDYAGGGLLPLNPVHVRLEDGGIHSVFDFADNPLVPNKKP